MIFIVVALVWVLLLASVALGRLAPNVKRKRNLTRSLFVLALTALGPAMLHRLEAAVWATLYLGIGALDERAERNVVFARRDHELWARRNLPGRTVRNSWARSAVNGLNIFSLTTALILTVIQDVGRTISPPANRAPPDRRRRVHRTTLPFHTPNSLPVLIDRDRHTTPISVSPTPTPPPHPPPPPPLLLPPPHPRPMTGRTPSRTRRCASRSPSI